MSSSRREPTNEQGSENNSDDRHYVFETWNETRNDEFPHVLEYRRRWEQHGFEVRVTPNEDIRIDVEKLVRETNETHLLKVFDDLPTTNMQFDFWRFSKLYLEGGTYADVDVDPKPRIEHWRRRAEDEKSVVLFEESATIAAYSVVLKILRPIISNFQEFPSYASCLVIAPGPKAPFFLDLLNAVDIEKWRNVPEPRRTLMTTGPGILTRFALTRDKNDVILVRRSEYLKSFTHRGFGTWKSSSMKNFENVGGLLCIITIFLIFYKICQTLKKRRQSEDIELSPFLEKNN